MEKEEIAVEAPIRFTEGAINKLREIQKEQSEDIAPFLRIGVKGGGCSGLSYLLAFDQKEENDKEFVIQEIPVIMNQAHVM